MANSTKPSNLLDLRAHLGYKPDVVRLACHRVATARRQTGLSRPAFASSLRPLLGWMPSPEVIKSWETAVAPPGEVVIACEVVASQAAQAMAPALNTDTSAEGTPCDLGCTHHAAGTGSPKPLSDRLVFAVDRGTGEDEDDMLRRSLLIGSAFAAATVVAPELLGRAESITVSRVGDPEVKVVQQMARQFRSMDRRLGGARVRPIIVDYLTTTVHGYLRNGCATERTRNALLVAAADLTRLVGSMIFDSGEGHADRYLMQAISLSELADDKAF